MIPQSSHWPSSLLPRVVVGVFAALALLSPRLCAGEPKSSAEPAAGVEFKVTELPRIGRLITVPVNKAVLVDFSTPLKEVRLTNPEIADVAVTAANQILITGKAFGTTQLVAWVDGDRQQIFDVAVELDLERLRASIRSAVPQARVEANSVLNAVVLTGTVPDAESAQRIAEIASIYWPNVVNHMRVAGVQQVLLRVTVAEVNRSATRELGFNGWIAGDNVRDMFVVNQLDGINPVDIGGAASVDVRGRIPFLTDQQGLPLQGSTTLSFGFPRVQMQVFIRALRENGLLKILAEPNLVTISGQEAQFLAGGEFPIPVPQGGLSNAVTIEYREFGVRLKFTPVVLSPNAIRLKVAPEVSEPDYASAVTMSGYVVPGLIQRRVETTVELGPGQTFAIGGLLSERTRGISRKIPALGDIPILGALFSSVDYQQDETELVVLVTPELVEPLTPDQVAYVPGADLVAPNDAELFLEGRIEGRRRENATATSEAASRIGEPAAERARLEHQYGPALSRLRGPAGPGSEEGS